MNDSMLHRGPDDGGEEIFEHQGIVVGLAQRRLSILDLSPAGHQPMFSYDGSVGLAFNGEIYNFLELREELKDYPYSSHTDTEVILAGYLKWGVEVFKRLNGMFAIALYDKRENRCILARDRFGKKPLYYYHKGGELSFASELKPLMLYPHFEKTICKEALGRYLYHGYIQAPETIFENTYKLEPAHYIAASNGKLEKVCYWDLPQSYLKGKENQLTNYEEAKQMLTEQLLDAVKRRLIADVPVGALLSGGIDSTLVTALAQQSRDTPIQTFSIGFTDTELDEAPYAQRVAEYLGTKHTACYITEEQMREQVESIPKYFDEPMADSAAIPTMLISRIAKERVTVTLSGDGGDELFCGYARYDEARTAQRLDALGAVLNALCGAPAIRRLQLLNRLPIGLQELALNRNPKTKSQWGGELLIHKINEMLPGPYLPVKYEIEGLFAEKDFQRRLMLVDQLTVLPEKLLSKVDRASMKYSLENRCPILDYRIAELSYRMPQDFLYRRGEKKAILKDIAYSLVPKAIMDRPKQGFTVPIDRWLRGPLGEKLTGYAEEKRLEEQGLFNSRAIRETVGRYQEGESAYSKLVWHFFIFQSWYQEYMTRS